MPFVSGFELLAKEEGRQEGLREGRLQLTLELLEERFGPIELEVRNQITDLNIKQIERLGLAQLKFKSLNDLNKWLATRVQKSAK